MGRAVAIRADISAKELRRLARLEDNGRVTCRLLALANALDGMSRARTARQAGMDRQALRDWVVRFNQQSVEGLQDRPRRGEIFCNHRHRHFGFGFLTPAQVYEHMARAASPCTLPRCPFQRVRLSCWPGQPEHFRRRAHRRRQQRKSSRYPGRHR
jgi:hypothetical protein